MRGGGGGGGGCERLTIFVQSRVPLGPGKFHVVVLVQTRAQMKRDGMHFNVDAVCQGGSKFARETSKTQTAFIGSIFSAEQNSPF